MKDFEKILSAIVSLPAGTAIPKPQSADSSRVDGWGVRRGEKALIYAMPNHSKPERPHKKGVSVSEFRQAYERLVETGEFTRAWFNNYMPDCNKEGPCNFTTIGGIFRIIGVCEYCGSGLYRAK